VILLRVSLVKPLLKMSVVHKHTYVGYSLDIKVSGKTCENEKLLLQSNGLRQIGNL